MPGRPVAKLLHDTACESREKVTVDDLMLALVYTSSVRSRGRVANIVKTFFRATHIGLVQNAVLPPCVVCSSVVGPSLMHRERSRLMY